MKMRWRTITSNVSIRTISPTATPLPKAYDCVAVYIAGRRTNLVVYGWRPKPPTKRTSDVESVSMLWCCHVCPLTRFRSTIVGWPCRVAPSHRHLRPRHHYQRRCRDTSCPPHWPASVRPQSISDRGYLDCMHSRIHGGLEKHKGNNLGLHRANFEHCVQFTFSYLYLYRIPFFVEFPRSGGYFFNILF